MRQRGRFATVVAAVAGIFLVAGPAGAGQGGPVAGASGDEGSVAFQAVRAATSIVIDGRLNEEAWGLAPPANGFRQRKPDEGQAESEKTEVRVIYDGDALYVGARMFDREPSRIVRRLARRDGDPECDLLVVLLDPNHDHRNGYRFEVGAGGSLADKLLYDDSNSDSTWDGVWDAAVQVDDQGWTAELRIPFSQLRFGGADEQTWGFNVIRYVQRRNEEAWLTLVASNDTRVVSAFGHLAGLNGIRASSHLDLLPYATAGGQADGTANPADPFNAGRRALGGVGLDLKWGLSSNVTLDAAVNPDFGQVEVDPAVVNLTAFETFYEEKRPFFLEGSDLYGNFGRNGLVLYGRFGATYPSLYYSRRVGRAPQGSAAGDFVGRPDQTTILGAGKLTARTSAGWSIAVLDALTGSEHAKVLAGGTQSTVEVEPPTNYLAGRVRRDVGQRGGIGFIGTSVERNLQTAGLAGRLANRAATFGVDGNLFFGAKRTWVVSGSAARSYVAGDAAAMTRLQRSSARYFQRPDADYVEVNPAARSLSGWSGEIDVNRRSGNLLVDGALWAVSPGFESNDFGYSPDADRIGAHGGLILRKTTPDRVTRSRSLTFVKYNMWNFQHDALRDGGYVQADATFLNYWNSWVEVEFARRVYDDRLTRGGPVMRRLANGAIAAGLGSDSRKAVSVSAYGVYGTNRRGGWSSEVNASIQFKPAASLTISAGPTIARGHTLAQYVRSVADPTATATYGGRYVFADLEQTELSMSTRVNWILSPRMSVQVYAQPLVSVGDYSQFKELMQPRTFSFARYGLDAGTITRAGAGENFVVDPDGAGPASTFEFADPSFNIKSIRLNAVFRWEWRLGSTLYAVWTEQREDDSSPGDLQLGRDLRALARAPGGHVLMIKVAYWFSR